MKDHGPQDDGLQATVPAVTKATIPPVVLECQRLRTENAALRAQLKTQEQAIQERGIENARLACKSAEWNGTMVSATAWDKLVAENAALKTQIEERAALGREVMKERDKAEDDNAALREVRSAVLAHLKITDTEYALRCNDGDFNPEFTRLLRALHATMERKSAVIDRAKPDELPTEHAEDTEPSAEGAK